MIFNYTGFNQKIAVGILIGVLFLLHISTANLFGLSVDEAHYGLFALHLDFSYFDHPPMVAWLLYLVKPLGFNDFSIRIPPILIMSINNILLFIVSRKIYPDSKTIPFWTVVLFNLGAAVQLISWGMVPDVPLISWTLLLVMLVMNMQQQNSIYQWLALGTLLGLLGLTKYTAIAIPIGLTIWLWSEKMLFIWLKQWQFWVAILVAILLISPVLYWNYTHDWISFNYQINHGTKGSFHIKNILAMLLAEFISFAPLLFVFAIIATSKILFGKKTKAESLLVYLALVYLLMVLWASGNGELLPHWATLGFLLLSPVAAKQLTTVHASVVQQLGIIIVSFLSILIVISIFILILFKPTNFNLHTTYQDLVGWQQAATIGKQLAISNKINYLWISNWTKASRIAWYAYPMPVQVITDKTNQFTLWHGNADKNIQAIWIVPNQKTINISPIDNVSCKKLKSFDYKINEVSVNFFDFYRCQPIHE